MAIFEGQAAASLADRTIRRFKWILSGGLTLVVVLSFGGGFVIAKGSLWLSIPFLLIMIALFVLAERWAEKQMVLMWSGRKGMKGEEEAVLHLEDLPDTYTVFSDFHFKESFGDIDHLVIGPTGIFAVDVKNWSGVVVPDGKGELLLNRRPTDKPVVRQFTSRIMDLKDRLRALTKTEPYIQAVFAFAHTHVEAKWGATASVHCVRLDKIAEYITSYRSQQSFSAKQIVELVAAARALKEIVQEESRYRHE